MPYGLGASRPVMTAMTPSSCSARLGSMRLMWAWGCGECRILPTSMPGSERSSVYFPAPVVLAAASTIGIERPMMEKLVIRRDGGATTNLYWCDGDFRVRHTTGRRSFHRRHSLLLGFNRSFDGLVHLRVSGTAAQIAAQGFADFVVGGAGIGRQQLLHRHHEAGGAETALCPSPVAVGFLDCCKCAVLGDAFNRRDLLAFATGSQQRAGEHGRSVDEDGARAAGGIIASALGAGKFELTSQRVEQERVWRDRDLVCAAIHGKLKELLFHYRESVAIPVISPAVHSCPGRDGSCSGLPASPLTIGPGTAHAPTARLRTEARSMPNRSGQECSLPVREPPGCALAGIAFPRTNLSGERSTPPR